MKSLLPVWPWRLKLDRLLTALTLACLAFLLTDFGDLSAPITIFAFTPRVELTSGMIVSPDVKPISPRAGPRVNDLT